MKELSIEEKAKRYDEVIKVVKSNYETIVQMDNDCTFAKEGIVNTFHHMFPELKESEDEMMVKFIKQQLFNIKKTITENYELDTKLTKAIDWLEKQGEQKLAWSEKDEEMLDSIIEEVRYIGDFPDYPTKEENELYDECLAKVEWLKSLKDRYTWKPSEEQMLALNIAIEMEDGDILKSLYQDLLKLKEV